MRFAYLLLPALLLSACASTQSDKPVRQKTDRQLDLAIDGAGFFIVQTSAGGFLFTRNGEMSVASTGEIVNNDGYRLYPPVQIPPETNNIIVTPDGVVRTQHAGQAPEVAGQIVLSRFEHPEKLDHDGIYRMPTERSGNPVTAKPGLDGLGTLITGALEQ
jgi:flagellar basal-body rod protein FlgG